jgi:hypothetical protein
MPPRRPRAPAAPPYGEDEPLDWLRDLRRLLSVEEVADILGVPPKKVYELSLPRIAVTERRYRWDPATLRRWLVNRSAEGGFAAFCASLEAQAAPLSVSDVGELLRIDPRAVRLLGVRRADATTGGTTGEDAWTPATLTSWLRARVRVPSHREEEVP